MNTENKIKTLFEFTSEGYDTASEECNALLEKTTALNKEKKELNKTYKETDSQLTKLIAKWEQFERTLNSSSTNKQRDEFVQTKNAIQELTLVKAKAYSQQQTNAKALEAENKKLKEAAELTAVYRKVLDELKKGVDNAEVSISSLEKAKKHLNIAMKEAPTSTEQYRELSKELSLVQRTINNVTQEQKQQIKQEGIHGNSIEALRQRAAALNKEWREMDRSSPDFEKTRNKLKELTIELNEVEAEVGIFSRNVGNYKSGFDGLGMSLAQLTREAPAFAHSMTTGFMAISNNIPMLFDELKKLRLENAALNAEGIKTPPIWKSVAKSFLSWNTAVSLGIVLLTVYGKDIVEWIGSLFKAENALNKIKVAQDNVSAAMAEGTKNAQASITQLKTLYAITQDTTLSTIERTKAAQKMQDLYPSFLRNISTEAILLGQAKAQYEQLVVSILAAAKARAAEEKLVENINKIREIEQTAGYQKIIEYQAKIDALTKKGIDSGPIIRGIKGWLNTYISEFKKANKELYEEINKLGLNPAQFVEVLNKSNDDLVKTVADGYKQELSEVVATTNNTQKNINDAYIKAAQDRQKAIEDVAKAGADGDKKGVELYRKILAEKKAAFTKASLETLTLTQLEKDELELAEYLHQQNLIKIAEDAKKDIEEKQKKEADDFLKAKNDVRAAEADLLEAKKRGNAVEIELYERLLAQKQATLKEFNAEQIKLDEEQLLAEDMAQFDHQQKVINDYITLQQQLSSLQEQYGNAQTQSEREAIQKQIDIINAKVAAQLNALTTLGINADEIIVEANNKADDSQQQLTERLQQSLQTIEKYAGRSKNAWFKLSASVSSLVAKVFDIKEIRKKYGNDAKGIKAANEEIKQSMIDLGAAVVINGLNAATDLINQNIEAEKSAIDEMYSYQEKRAQESYDTQNRQLKLSLDNKEISEAKYRLEQMKLDNKKAKDDNKREKDKANALYDIELKQFRVQQAQDAISAIIATSLAVMQAYAQTGPISGSVFAAIVSGLGAAQVAAIYAQQPPEKPKFEKGGVVRFEQLDGASHSQGGIPIRFGNKVVAEAEGDEGALIISKKAMRNSYMKRLLAQVEAANAGISGEQKDESIFEEGGEIDFKNYIDDFFEPAKLGLRITKRKKKSIYINGKKVKLKDYGGNADNAINAKAEEIANPLWNEYVNNTTALLKSREESINNTHSEGIKNNETLKGLGITDTKSYNEYQANKEAELDDIQKEIKTYEELANARIDALKEDMQYEERIVDFDKQRKDAAEELAKTTEEFNTRMLLELKESGQITEEEYLSMLDQVTKGYGVKTADIINLKKKEVEAIKKLINEERDAELNAAKEATKYQEDALAQMRSEWEENYNAVTDLILNDVENAGDAISQLTGTDLERFNQILHIQQEMRRMEDDFQKNDTLLTDGVIESREERATLIAEQKRIKEELALKEKEAEEAKAAFEAERQKNMDTVLKAYETDNFAALLEQIKELGTGLQAEGNKWTLDKELAAQLDAELQGINNTYDEQIAKQDAIIDGLQAELNAAQLLHDKKVIYIKEEEDALKASFEQQKAAINEWLAKSTADMRITASNLNSVLSALKVAGYEAGLSEYEKAMGALNKDLDSFEAAGKDEKFEKGGAIELGSGLFQVSGNSHSQGGVPVRVGNTQIAEVEGIEKMFAVNKLAAFDPEMIAALNKASDVNARYTGAPLITPEQKEGFALDYDLLAAKIGAQINMRPSKAFMTHRDIRSACDITDLHRQASLMK